MNGSMLGRTLKLSMARGRKDYDFSDANTGYKQLLADFEEMEEQSETFRPGRKALGMRPKAFLTGTTRNLQQMGS